jgi:hypothetical protein
LERAVGLEEIPVALVQGHVVRPFICDATFVLTGLCDC